MEKKERVKNEIWREEERERGAERDSQPGHGGMQGNSVSEKKATKRNKNKDMSSESTLLPLQSQTKLNHLNEETKSFILVLRLGN